MAPVFVNLNLPLVAQKNSECGKTISEIRDHISDPQCETHVTCLP